MLEAAEHGDKMAAGLGGQLLQLGPAVGALEVVTHLGGGGGGIWGEGSLWGGGQVGGVSMEGFNAGRGSLW